MRRGVRAVVIEGSSLLALVVLCSLVSRLPLGTGEIRSGTIVLADGTRVEFHSTAEYEELASRHRSDFKSMRYTPAAPVAPMLSQVAMYTGLGLYACFRNRSVLRARLTLRPRHLGLVAGGAVALPAVIWGLVHVMRSLGLEPPDRGAMITAQMSDSPIATALVVAVLGPLAEELYFRGWLFDGLSSRFGTLGVVLATSIPFAIVHGSAILFPAFLTAGLGLAVLRIWSGGLVVPILVHMLNNGGMVAYAIVAGAGTTS